MLDSYTEKPPKLAKLLTWSSCVGVVFGGVAGGGLGGASSNPWTVTRSDR